MVGIAALSLGLAATLGGTAGADVGDGGDPTAVNLRVSLPSHAKLSPTITANVRSFSEANGPQPSAFSGTARFGVDRSGPGLVLRGTVAKVSVRGSTSSAGTGRLKITLTSAQRAAIRKAAERAHRRSMVLNVVLRGHTPGRSDTSKTNAHLRISVR